MPGWHTLSMHVAPAEEQLALTEELWRRVAAGKMPPTLRWYTYDAPALVLGVGQEEGLLGAHDPIPVVKRASGGAIVLAGTELIALDVALPTDSQLVVQDVVESYRWLGEAFQEALASLAPHQAVRVRVVAPEEARADQLAQRSAPRGSVDSMRGLACFGVLSPYEVVLTDSAGPAKKLIGFSQIRKRGVVLFQVGFYAAFGGERLARFVAGPEGFAAALDARIASLADVDLSVGPVVEAVTRAIEARDPRA